MIQQYFTNNEWFGISCFLLVLIGGLLLVNAKQRQFHREEIEIILNDNNN